MVWNLLRGRAHAYGHADTCCLFRVAHWSPVTNCYKNNGRKCFTSVKRSGIMLFMGSAKGATGSRVRGRCNMQVCTVVLNQGMDSLAVSAVGNDIFDAGSLINTDVIADYLTDMLSPSELGEENAERIGKARKSGDLEDLVQVAKLLGFAPEIFFNKLGN